MRLGELLRWGAGRISAADARWLMAALLHLSLGALALEGERRISPATIRRYRGWVGERKRGKPLQYITGEAPFYGRDFAVDRRVLIPRPETEVLTELALDWGDRLGSGRVRMLDLCSGSGAIAVTIKAERPDWIVEASDIDAGAVALTKKNAKRAGVDLQVYKGDLFAPFKRRAFQAQIIVSNPPYLDRGRDRVAKDVLKWEPAKALFPAKGAAAFADSLIREALLVNSGSLRGILLELSPRVAAQMEKRWRADARFVSVRRAPDLAGRPRFLLLELAHG